MRSDWLATARLRFGYAFDTIMPYVTAGAAISRLVASTAGAPLGTAAPAVADPALATIMPRADEISRQGRQSIELTLAFAVVNHLGDRSQEVNEIRRRKDAATTEWNQAQSQWQTRTGSQSFDTKRSELERLKQKWDQLPNVRLRKLDELKTRQRQLQMEEFLDRFEIDRATIPSIGPGRKQTLSVRPKTF